MPLYRYKAQMVDGKVISDRKIAVDERDLKSILRNENLFLMEAEEVVEKKKSVFFSIRSTVSKTSVTTFMRQLSVMISSGVSVEDAINTLKFQESSVPFKNVLTSIHDDLLKGVFLSDAFAKYPKVFPPFFKNMIYIAELSGSLDMVLVKLADYYERDRKIKGKAKSAMVYPMFLLFLIVAVFVFLMVFIIPQFEDMLSELGGEMPLITRIIIDASRFVTLNFPFILTGVLLLILLSFLFFRTKRGRLTKDYLKLKLPLIRTVTYFLITARFARGFGVLVASGMSIMDSIETIGRLMENKVFEKKFEYAVGEVKRGKRIARSIANLKFFPVMLTEMIAVGEKTGNLDNVLESTANFYDEKLEQSIEKATSALEPLLIIFAGGMVGIVILSIFLPIISLMGSIR
ncbi:MAG: type II secretion system F family protein [Acholeplasmataceae bacterium]